MLSTGLTDKVIGVLAALRERGVRWVKAVRRLTRRADLADRSAHDADRLPGNEAFEAAASFAKGEDARAVLSFAELGASEPLEDASTSRLRSAFSPGLAADGSHESFLIRVNFKLGDQPDIHYRYRSHVGPGHARMLQSLGYVHCALQTWFLKETDRAALTEVRAVCIDAGDMAVFPGTIGYDRARGDVAVHLVPDVHFYMTRGYEHLRSEAELGWNSRQPRFVWRGSTTGGGALHCGSIVHLPRYGLCLASQRFGDVFDVGFTDVVQTRSARDADALRMHFLSHGIWRERLERTEVARYKYVIDIDGNAGSWGFFEKLLMGSCVVKIESLHEQWFYKDLTPWLHYIPVRNDLADLDEVVSWCVENDDECRAIGQAGRAFALEKDFAGQMSLTAATIIEVSTPSTPDLQ